MEKYINVIGGGLAGCEAAYQIAKQKIKVKLYEMKPINFSNAHSNKNLAEIVCSNSFKSNDITNACRIVKRRIKNIRLINNKMCRQNKTASRASIGSRQR